MDKMDCKILAEVFRVLLERGAASTERLLRETKLEQPRTIQWACYQLGCDEKGGLWTLPDRMIPKDWEWDPATMPAVVATRLPGELRIV